MDDFRLGQNEIKKSPMDIKLNKERSSKATVFVPMEISFLIFLRMAIVLMTVDNMPITHADTKRYECSISLTPHFVLHSSDKSKQCGVLSHCLLIVMYSPDVHLKWFVQLTSSESSPQSSARLQTLSLLIHFLLLHGKIF